MATYNTSAGDVLDRIVFLHYGEQSPELLRAVLDANRGLADFGPVLPAGVSVHLPDLQRPASTAAGVSLWD